MERETTTERPRFLSPRERRQRNREEMVGAILQVARELMRQEGVAALNLREVARRVGIQGPSLYEYFPSKMALYNALFAAGVHLFVQRQNALFQTNSSFWDTLRAAMEAYMGFAQDYPELYQLIFERPVPGFVPTGEGLTQSQELLGIADRIAERGIDQGIFRPGMPVDKIRDLIVSTIHGMTAQHRANEPELPVGEGRFGCLVPLAMDFFRAYLDRDHVQTHGYQ